MTPKPGVPLNEPQPDWWTLIGEWAHDHAIYTKDRPDTVEVAALQAFLDEMVERMARGISLIDVELLAQALAVLRTSKAIENVWWTAEIYPKANLTAFGFADRIIEEYTRLARLPVEEGERP